MTNPYWWEAAPPAALPPADLPAHAEIVIIGAGFTGLSAAITLAQAGRDVVVIEKGQNRRGRLCQKWRHYKRQSEI